MDRHISSKFSSKRKIQKETKVALEMGIDHHAYSPSNTFWRFVKLCKDNMPEKKWKISVGQFTSVSTDETPLSHLPHQRVSLNA